MTRPPLQVRRVPVAEIRELRHAVLRPGEPLGGVDYPQDPDAVHLAAYLDEEPDPVGCLTLFPAALTGAEDPDGERAWQLRGMAVRPAAQRSGVGRALVDAAASVAREAGVPLLWANARQAATGFYLAAGWRLASEPFVLPPTMLVHHVVTLDLRGRTALSR